MCSEARGWCPEPKEKVLLIFADSLAYYGPAGGLPADDPRIWPNIVGAVLGWEVELIGRIGWTCRDVWWAATQDPRAWAALSGRDFVSPDDIRSVALPVLEHRLLLRPESELEGVRASEVLDRILHEVAVPR